MTVIEPDTAGNNPPDTIRLLLVDDHTVVRQGIRSLLEFQDDLEVVGEASGGGEAITKASELGPDVILMDLAMPGTNGAEATRQIKAEHPDIQVLALSMHGTDDYVLRVLEAGASGYILKEADAAELSWAIRVVHTGGVYIDPSLTRMLIERYFNRAETGDARTTHRNLTNRERGVLALIGEGLTNEEIAGKLGLSPHTVQTHRSNIMEKLGLHNRAQLVTYAARVGLIGPATL